MVIRVYSTYRLSHYFNPRFGVDSWVAKIENGLTRASSCFYVASKSDNDLCESSYATRADVYFRIVHVDLRFTHDQ